MAWAQGTAVIADMLRRGVLLTGQPSPYLAEAQLDEARRHMSSATVIAGTDPVGATTLVYDSAVKALASMLVAQGLTVRDKRDDIAIYDAISAQFDPPFGVVLAPFMRMRSRQFESERSAVSALNIKGDDVRQDLLHAKAIVYFAYRLSSQLEPFEYAGESGFRN